VRAGDKGGDVGEVEHRVEAQAKALRAHERIMLINSALLGRESRMRALVHARLRGGACPCASVSRFKSSLSARIS
jgi:hypothetical protein